MESNATEHSGVQLWRAKGVFDEDVLEEFEERAHFTEDIWKRDNSTIDFLIFNEERKDLAAFLDAYNVSHTVLIDDVRENVDDALLKKFPPRHSSFNVSAGNPGDVLIIQQLKHLLLNKAVSGDSFTWKSYPSLQEVNDYLKKLATSYPMHCKMITLGKTIHFKPIYMLRITNGDRNNKPILVDSGIHGREWTSVISTLYFIDFIVRKFYQQPEYITKRDWYDIIILKDFNHTILRTGKIILLPLYLPPNCGWFEGQLVANNPFQFYVCNAVPYKTFALEDADPHFRHIIPVLNPDGYDYSLTTDRLWTKNRRKLSGNCYGVDLNRNFNYNWGKHVSTLDPCKDSYGGPVPFTEEETKAFKRLTDSTHFYGYLSVHSAGTKVLYPLGADHNDHRQHLLMTKEIALAMRKIDNQRFLNRDVTEMGTNSFGMAMDWMHFAKQIKHSYVIETRGHSGLDIIPPQQILLAAKEVSAGLMKFAEALKYY